jgi:hypothetical protein
MDQIDEPRYSELGTGGSRPPGSSWGVFGADEEVGTLNRVTADAIVHAASLVTSGQVFSLNWDIDKP